LSLDQAYSSTSSPSADIGWTAQRLALTVGSETVLVAESQKTDVPGDLEIVLKLDMGVIYRTLKE
jgi:hypothetical protein